MEQRQQLPKGNVTWSEIRMLLSVGTVLVAIVLAWTSLSTKLDLLSQQQGQYAAQQSTTSTDIANIKDKQTQMAIDIATIKQIIADNQAKGLLSSAAKPNKQNSPVSIPAATPVSGVSASLIPQTITYNNQSTNQPQVASQPVSQPTQSPTPVPTPTQAATLPVSLINTIKTLLP